MEHPATMSDDGLQDAALGALSLGERYIERSLRFFWPYLASPVLELGAGTGNVTLELLREGYHVIATDISEERLASLRERQRRRFPGAALETACVDLGAPGALRGLAREHQPRCIVSFNLLEHLADDRACVASAFDALPSKGTFCLLVPAHQQLYSRFDQALGHFRRYTQRGVRALLADAGFEVTQSQYLNAIGAVGWWLKCRLLGHTRLSRLNVAVADWLSPMLTLEARTPPPFGLSVVAVGVKP